jgi:uncharacterized protein YuzE
MSIRIEQYDGGEVLYIALDPDGVWAKSEFPDDLVTIDYNAQGGIIGIEVLGSLAQAGATAVVRALITSDRLQAKDAVREMLQPILAQTA